MMCVRVYMYVHTSVEAVMWSKAYQPPYTFRFLCSAFEEAKRMLSICVLCNTLTSIAYLVISKTESSLLLLLQNLHTNDARSHLATFLHQKKTFLLINNTRVGISSIYNTSKGLMKGS